MAIDSTVIQFHQLLADDFESTHENQAASKAHVVANAVDRTANFGTLTGQTTHATGPVKTIEKWVRDCLLLMDPGHYDFNLFHRIDHHVFGEVSG